MEGMVEKQKISLWQILFMIIPVVLLPQEARSLSSDFGGTWYAAGALGGIGALMGYVFIY
jgi:hypothetical protein